MTISLDENIQNIDVSNRLKNKLTSSGIYTLRQVLDNTEKVFDIEQLGQKCFSEIDMILESIGIESNLSKYYQNRIKKPKNKRMKLEIVKEEKFNEPIWYFLRVDGISYQCSRNLEEIEDLYNKFVEDPELIKEKKTVLKSQEI